MRNRYRDFKDRIGKRGACLISVGVVWFMTGVMMFLDTTEDYIPGYYFYDHFYYIRAVAWVVSGIIAILFSWKPQGRDWPGWTAVMIMAVFRVLAYFQGWLHSMVADTHDWRGLVGGLGFVGVAALLRITASWKEPDRTIEKRDDR